MSIITKSIKYVLPLPADFFLWREIQKKARIQQDEWAFLCNRSLGDTYAFCSFLPLFLRKTNSKKLVIVAEKRFDFILDMFGKGLQIRFVPVERTPSDMFHSLMSILFISDTFSRQIKMKTGSLLPFYFFTNRSTLNQLDYYRLFLDLPLDAAPAVPNRPAPYLLRKARKKLAKLGLPKNKTAIIYPEAKTFGSLNAVWLSKMKKRLLELGWTPVIHTREYDKTRERREVIEIPLIEQIATAEAAGWVIGPRSGMFDLLSSANCKKTIIYPIPKSHEKKEMYLRLSNISRITLIYPHVKKCREMFVSDYDAMTETMIERTVQELLVD